MKKNAKKCLFTAVFAVFFMPYIVSAACSPTSVQMCVAIDDVADVWINDSYIGQFNYVNWDQTGVYPTCVTITPSLLQETGNIIAIKVRNTACCEIWGSWSIQAFCSDGSNACLTSDDPGMRLYPVLTPSISPPPVDGSGNEWWEIPYADTGIAPWQDAVVDTGTIYGKLIYDPCTGSRLQPLSYDSGGNADLPDMHIYMRQPFSLTPVPTLPPPSFTISKSVIGATTGINTNDRVTYQLVVCNTGTYIQGDVAFTDDHHNGFSFDGPHGGDCSGYGDGSLCMQGGSGIFTGKWMRGFEGQSCVTITARVVDYWVDSSEWCQVRDNVASITWAGGTPAVTSEVVNVTMYCPGTPTPTRTRTPTRTITLTHTFSPTVTVTLTQTVTSTRTRIPTYTHSPTPYPTNHTRTATPSITRTVTLTVTPTFTRTATPTVTQTWVNAVVLVKSQDRDTVPLGETVQYCIEFTNAGENPATFNIWDTIPGPLDFLYCTENCTGPVTYDTGPLADQCPGSPGNDCRVINWTFTGVPAGATGSVCFWVLAARLQSVEFEILPGSFYAYIREIGILNENRLKTATELVHYYIRRSQIEGS